MFLISRAFGNPAAQQGDFGRLEGFVRLGGRHDFIFFSGFDALNERALIGLSWHDGWSHFFVGGEGRGRTVQAQARFSSARIRPVAGVAIFCEDGLDVLVKRELNDGICWRCCRDWERRGLLAAQLDQECAETGDTGSPKGEGAGSEEFHGVKANKDDGRWGPLSLAAPESVARVEHADGVLERLTEIKQAIKGEAEG